MKIKELIKQLQQLNQEAEILLGSDEELNTLYKDIQVEYYNDENQSVIWGNSGSEIDEV